MRGGLGSNDRGAEESLMQHFVVNHDCQHPIGCVLSAKPHYSTLESSSRCFCICTVLPPWKDRPCRGKMPWSHSKKCLVVAKNCSLRSAEITSVFRQYGIPRIRVVIANDVPGDVHEERLRHADLGLHTRFESLVWRPPAIYSGWVGSSCASIHAFILGSPLA